MAKESRNYPVIEKGRKRYIREIENKPFTTDEVIDLLELFVKKGMNGVISEPRWSVLFDLYNDTAPYPLGMGCAPCYTKVAVWMLVKLRREANPASDEPVVE